MTITINYIAQRMLMVVGNVARRLTGRLTIDLMTYYKVDESSELRVSKSAKIRSRYFHVGCHSSVILGPNCIIDGFFHVGDDCTVVIGSDFRMTNHPTLLVDNNSIVQIDDHCLFDETPHAPASICVRSGSLAVQRNVTIRGLIKVNGGSLTIGSDSFLNYGSETRSEAKVSIGNHVLISYFVDVFDTNTHSTDWHKRRQEIDTGFPNGTIQTDATRPDTMPITIGDDVWIGKYSAILKGVSIGSRSIVGTRSVVTKSCPEDSLVTGNPAVHRPLSANDDIN